jgi:hypothetical protein
VCDTCGALFSERLGRCPRDGGAVEASAKDPWLGRRLDARYFLTKRIADHEGGRAYAARHVRLERPFMVDVMYGDATAPPAAAAALRRGLAHVRHPHIVSAVDAGQTPAGALYVVFEALEGETLAAQVRRRALSEREAWWILRAVGEAIAHVHEAGLVHGAVSPRTIYLRHVDDTVTAQLLARGAAGHVAAGGPEAEASQGASSDPSRDWWGLGAAVAAGLRREGWTSCGPAARPSEDVASSALDCVLAHLMSEEPEQRSLGARWAIDRDPLRRTWPGSRRLARPAGPGLSAAAMTGALGLGALLGGWAASAGAGPPEAGAPTERRPRAEAEAGEIAERTSEAPAQRRGSVTGPADRGEGSS